LDAIAQKFIEFADTPWAGVFLFIHSFMESSFLPGAHDIFLIAVSIAHPHQSMCFIFAIYSTIGSVCGGSFAYLIGQFGGRPLFEKVFPHRFTDKVEEYFKKYGIWAVAIAGFTPLPYKVFSVAAGIFKVPFIPFVIVSLITRAMRFFLVSAILYWVGPQIKDYIVDYFDVFSSICVIVVILYVVLIRSLRKKDPAIVEKKA
jgi:membrane protein YqaA with SNARE-associated domain